METLLARHAAGMLEGIISLVIRPGSTDWHAEELRGVPGNKLADPT